MRSSEGVALQPQKVGPDGIITTFAGTGLEGNTGDGGPALQAGIAFGGFAEFEALSLGSLVLGPDDSLYFAQSPVRFGQPARVRRISRDGIITAIGSDHGILISISTLNKIYGNRIGVISGDNGNGRLSKRLISIIPPIEPTPNTTMYDIPTSGDGIVDNTNSISAPLPANP